MISIGHNSHSNICWRTWHHSRQTKELDILKIWHNSQAILQRCGFIQFCKQFCRHLTCWSPGEVNYDILNWNIVVKKNIPRQHEGCSCGIFIIKYMQYWNGSEITSPFAQKDMETFRKMPALK
ncbi:hypothetical protein HU200_036115 [Digitaria exilis]|uniref:Ubiquitin-like protease family profile domain-containing protein n=1 Tax=Digitaria exilis TaxID=1010633 RepID=A0A835BH43_9POAL|nr:hypothetical protein HU200_036115 [Digitaria exilis]